MRYTLLGDSGLRVSEISLGTMTFGPDWGFGADSSDSRAQFEYYAEAGGTHSGKSDRPRSGYTARPDR